MKKLLVLSFMIIWGSSLLSQQKVTLESVGSIELPSTTITSVQNVPQENLLACVTSTNAVKVMKSTPLQEFATTPVLSQNVPIVSSAAMQGSLFYGFENGTLLHMKTSTLERNTYSSSAQSAITAILPIDENFVLIAQLNKQILYVNLSLQEGFKKLLELPSAVTSFALHPARKYIAAGSQVGDVYILSLGQFKILQMLSFPHGEVTKLCFSEDGKYLSAGTSSGAIGIWETETLTQVAHRVECSATGLQTLTFDPTNTFLVGACKGNELVFYSIPQFTPLQPVQTGTGTVVGLSFLNGESFVTVTSQGTITQWKLIIAPLDTVFPKIVFDNVPDQGEQREVKYFGSQYTISGIVYDNSEAMRLTMNGVEIPLKELLGEKRTIPEGMTAKRFVVTVEPDTTSIGNYAFECTDGAGNSTMVPFLVQWLSKEQAVEILSPAPDAETDLISIPLHFKTWFDISTYSVSVNMTDIIVDQEPGFDVVNNEIRETVPLLVGYNQVRLTIKSKTGETFSQLFGVTRKAGFSQPMASGEKKPRTAGSGPQRWAVVVGVSEYQNSGIPSLKYADKDAEAFANFLRRPQGGGFDSDHMRVLLNKDATLANIKDALINFLSQAIDIDLVIIYFAGHGAPEPGRPQNMYLLTYDSDPRALGTTAFPMWDIQTVLARYITAKRVIVFTDACHSGGISAEFATRGLGVTETNLINQYLADLARSKEGVVVFTASAAGEVSQEYPEYGHGVFTYFLLQGLEGKADYNNDYTITINELMQYVEEQVKRKTRGAQNPTRSQTKYDKDLTIAIIPH